MLKLRKIDWFTLGIVAAVIVVLILGARERAKQVPLDNKHRPFFAALEKGLGRADVERRCVICHNPNSLRLPEKHPPKEQCLICHRLGYRRS